MNRLENLVNSVATAVLGNRGPKATDLVIIDACGSVLALNKTHGLTWVPASQVEILSSSTRVITVSTDSAAMMDAVRIMYDIPYVTFRIVSWGQCGKRWVFLKEDTANRQTDFEFLCADGKFYTINSILHDESILVSPNTKGIAHAMGIHDKLRAIPVISFKMLQG